MTEKTQPTGWPHMLPCPFCGGDARHDAHADDCYFILHRKFKNSGADMSPAFEVLAAWNRRTPQPTQAQAGAVPLTDEQIVGVMHSIPIKAAPGDALDEAMRERDEAEDFINELLDEVLGADRPEWSSAYNRYDAMNDVQERMTALHKPAVDWAAVIGKAVQDAVLAARDPADSVPTTQFDDPKVQVVYAILCDDAGPPKGEHWEGFAARRIVDALSADSVLEDAAPLSDAQWQRIADLTDSILTRSVKDEIERVIGIKGVQRRN